MGLIMTDADLKKKQIDKVIQETNALQQCCEVLEALDDAAGRSNVVLSLLVRYVGVTLVPMPPAAACPAPGMPAPIGPAPGRVPIWPLVRDVPFVAYAAPFGPSYPYEPVAYAAPFPGGRPPAVPPQVGWPFPMGVGAPQPLWPAGMAEPVAGWPFPPHPPVPTPPVVPTPSRRGRKGTRG